MAANELTYAQANPQSLLRDAMFDMLPEVAAMGLAYSRIFGTPSLLGPGEIGRGRSIDMSNGGPLHGKLFVRNKRDLLGAAHTDNGATALSGQTIGAARSKIDRFAPAEVAYTMKQYSGYAAIPMHHIEHGFLDQAGEELLLTQRSMASVHLQLERLASNFFCGIAADNNGVSPGWTEVDWQAAATGGTALSSSDDFMSVIHSVIQAARIRAAGKVNAMYCSRKVIDKLAVEASVLGRVFVRNGGTAAVDAATENLKVGGFNSQHVLPTDAVVEILKQHLGLDEIVISDGLEESAAGRDYIFPADRMWIGSAGEAAVSLGAGSQPRLVSGAGSFVKLIGKADVQMGPEAGIAPQSYECISEVFCAPIALSTDGGTVIKNLG